ncbi:hypothetical protein TNCV_2683881 [Trichonephila clavipes]|nr:hypothetical protein TNCV_2683881 [Trichonephila clavipes]
MDLTKDYNLVSQSGFGPPRVLGVPAMRGCTLRHWAHDDTVSRAPFSENDNTMASLKDKIFEICLTLFQDEQTLITQHAEQQLTEFFNKGTRRNCELKAIKSF